MRLLQPVPHKQRIVHFSGEAEAQRRQISTTKKQQSLKALKILLTCHSAIPFSSYSQAFFVRILHLHVQFPCSVRVAFCFFIALILWSSYIARYSSVRI